MKLQRKQFTFYRSFWEAAEALPEKEQLDFIRALCDYALHGTEPTELRGAASIAAFCIVRPLLDKSRRQAAATLAAKSKGKGEAEEDGCGQNELCFTQ